MKKLTNKQYQSILANAEKAISSIPAAHNRIRVEQYNSNIITAIDHSKKGKELNQDTIKEFFNKKKTFIYQFTENLGTRKWQHNIQAVDSTIGKIVRETNCYYVLADGTKIAKNYLLAII